jgi:hypothetical protein
MFGLVWFFLKEFTFLKKGLFLLVHFGCKTSNLGEQNEKKKLFYFGPLGAKYFHFSSAPFLTLKC